MEAKKEGSVFSAMYRSFTVRQINVMYDTVVVHVNEAMPQCDVNKGFTE